MDSPVRGVAGAIQHGGGVHGLCRGASRRQFDQ